MGGLGGHVDHLYDNPDLSFTDMIKIMQAASNGEITGGEKLDGQNLFVSYSVRDGKAKAAPNREPEKLIPVTSPRSCSGIQL